MHWAELVSGKFNAKRTVCKEYDLVSEDKSLICLENGGARSQPRTTLSTHSLMCRDTTKNFFAFGALRFAEDNVASHFQSSMVNLDNPTTGNERGT